MDFSGKCTDLWQLSLLFIRDVRKVPNRGLEGSLLPLTRRKTYQTLNEKYIFCFSLAIIWNSSQFRQNHQYVKVSDMKTYILSENSTNIKSEIAPVKNLSQLLRPKFRRMLLSYILIPIGPGPLPALNDNFRSVA